MSETIPIACPPAPGPTRWAARVPAALPLILLAIAVYALNPIGYVGGGGDDWHYLTAAQCWAAQGACLPQDHWSARWPLVAPMAASIALFGESRAALALVPSGFALLCLILFASIVERLFGRSAALLGGCALLLTPAFAMLVARPNADLVELAFLLAAAACWLGAGGGRPRLFALLTGLAFALAFQTRETSVAAIAAAGVLFLALPREWRPRLGWAAPGFLLPIMAEMGAYWAAAGDPLGRYRLAMNHTGIPSTELAASVDTSRSPLFNPDFIAGWQPSNGIDLHWTVNPILNLATHPAIGLTLTAATFLFVALGRRLGAPTRRILSWGFAAAGGASLLLIYGLAIDPKPRMFLPLLCVAAAAAGLLLPAAWRTWPRILVAAACGAFALRSLLLVAAAPNVAPVESVAAHWVAAHAGAVTLDETTRRHLALVPAARALPVDDPARPLHLSVAWGECAARGGGRVEAEHSFASNEPMLARLARRRGLGLSPGDAYSLCLVRR